MFKLTDRSTFFTLLLMLAVSCVVAGCSRARLATGALTREQQTWVDDLRQWHPGWDEPYVSPIRTSRRAPASPLKSSSAQSRRTAPADSRAAVDEVILVPVDGQAGQEEIIQYEVRKGDTLSKIALVFLDDPNEWKKIWDLNRDVLESPHRLIPGMVLDLPAR